MLVIVSSYEPGGDHVAFYDLIMYFGIVFLGYGLLVLVSYLSRAITTNIVAKQTTANINIKLVIPIFF